MGMTVRAIGPHLEPGERKAVGYYNHKRRYPGDVFELKSDSHFSKSWMEEVHGVQADPEPETEPGPAPKGKAGRSRRARRA